MTNRDSFFSALQSLQQFVMETDVAFGWSIDEGGAPMIVFCNDIQRMEVVA